MSTVKLASMLRGYLKCLRLMLTIGVIIWFVGMPLLPFYDRLVPWPEANQRLTNEGITGVRFLVGVGGVSQQSGEEWKREKQRSFVVIPESLRRLEVFTYQETTSSDFEGIRSEFVREGHLLLPLAIWALAGLFSIRTVSRWFRKEKNINRD